MRERLLTALIAGEKTELTANQWSPITVGRLAAAVNVAEAALDAAKEHTQVQRSAALRSLVLQLILLTSALALTFGAMMVVTRRVITPLHNMRDAMLKVASGDLTVDTGYAQRQDEIGALAGALETFKQQAADKVRIEQQERERNAGAASRQQTIEGYVGEFESMVRQTLGELGEASGQMRTTSTGLTTVSRQTNARVEIAEKASGEASMSVETVAAASEELSASINDISRQAAHAAGIASRAVNQARETDGTVQGLARSAGRIGEVIGLINTIAAQTNLLALNATIEAARAGEAGRGFAVVASEVKSLASQTAKATEDISEQINDIQKVANDAIDAIKGIGNIIGEVNEVATAIAAAVQEQGAATQEITRSTQHAAQGTKNVSDNITGVKADADAAAAAAEDVKSASQTSGNPEPATRQSGHQFPGKDSRRLINHSRATTGTRSKRARIRSEAGEKFNAAPRLSALRPATTSPPSPATMSPLRKRRIVLDLDRREAERVLAVAGASGHDLVAIAECVRQLGIGLAVLGSGMIDAAAVHHLGIACGAETVARRSAALAVRRR